MSEKRVSPDERPKNQLLASLPADEFARLAPHLQTVPVSLKQVLHRCGEAIDSVYLPQRRRHLDHHTAV